MDEISGKILGIVRNLSPQAAGMKDDELLKTDYLDRGLIDSLQIVEMITEIENSFSIRFSHEDLESEKFRTLNGVIGLVGHYNKSRK